MWGFLFFDLEEEIIQNTSEQQLCEYWALLCGLRRKR